MDDITSRYNFACIFSYLFYFTFSPEYKLKMHDCRFSLSKLSVYFNVTDMFCQYYLSCLVCCKMSGLDFDAEDLELEEELQDVNRVLRVLEVS